VRILLIEDDAETARYISAGLIADGHDISHAEDGRIGLDRAAGLAWDCS
jgi:two-component system OmpR family response regulator